MEKTPLKRGFKARSLTFILGIALLLGACSEDQIIPRTPATPPPPPADIPTDPGNPVTEPTPNQPPTTTNKFVQLKWSEMDYQQVNYNEAGLVTHYVSQYNSVQGSTTVSNFTYEFHYDANQRLVKETSNIYGPVDFFYTGNQLTKAIENDKLNRPLKEYHYLYRADNKLEARVTYKVNLDNSKYEHLKEVYKYDAAGNLVLLENYSFNKATGQFELSTRIFFSHFDSKKAPIPFLNVFPHLPQVTSWVNNAGVKYIQDRNGNELVGRERYTYLYNANDYPTSQTRAVNIGEGRPDYTYSGNYIYNLN